MTHQTWWPMRGLRLALALLVALTALGAPSAQLARAADCLVPGPADSGPGTLRAAVNNTDGFVACTAITFQAGLGPVTLDTRLDIDHTVTITGPGQVVQRNAALPAAANGGVLGISGGTVVLNGLTIQGGRSAGTAGAGLGITGAEVTLDGVTVRDNVATNAGGGGISMGFGSLRLTNTLVEDNRADLEFPGILPPSGGGLFLDCCSLDVTIEGGSRITGNRAAGYGGGIYASDAPMTLTDATVHGNTAQLGGGLYTHGRVPIELTDATISGNTAIQGGGIYHLSGEMTLINSTVSGNTAAHDFGDGLGGGLYLQGLNPSRTTLINSTISGNSATGAEGWFSCGGGLYLENRPSATLLGSTVSGNSADYGGGICNRALSTLMVTNATVSGNTARNDGGGMFSNAAATLRFVTITGNVADSDADGVGSGGGLMSASSVGSSIIVGNRRGAATRDDCGSAVPSAGYNLAGAGCPTNGTTDIAYIGAVDAVLDPILAGNGWPTETHALVADSPARNQGDNATCNHVLPNGAGLVDQRGVARDDGQCDIGAYEFGPTFADLDPTDPAHTALTQLAARGIIKGYGDGRIGPDDPLQRAQLVAFVARATPLGPGTPPTTLTPPTCLVAGTWDCEDWGNTFTDQGGLDANLWRNVGTLAHHGVAAGYGDGTFGPTNLVTYAQTLALITRAMVTKGYWTPQPGAPVPAGVPAVHATDVATFFFYAGGLPVPADWSAPATRGWCAMALWAALDSD